MSETKFDSLIRHHFPISKWTRKWTKTLVHEFASNIPNISNSLDMTDIEHPSVGANDRCKITEQQSLSRLG